MSFNTLQAGVIRTLTTHADYSCDTVFADDFRALGAGNLRYVVISLGGVSNEDFTFRQVLSTWTINLDVYSIRTGELATAIDNAQTNMQNILDTLNQYPFLNDSTGVIDHNISTVSPVNLMNPGSGSRNAFLHQQLGLSVTEICTIIRAE